MRVLILLNGLTLGGIEVMFWRALPQLQERGIQLDFGVTQPGQALEEQFKAAGCQVWKLPKRANPRRGARELQAFLAEHPYAIVHSQYAYTAGAHAWGASLAGRPSIVSFHAATSTALYNWARKPVLKQLRNVWLQWQRQLILKHASCLLGHSRSNLDAFKSDWEEDTRCRLIYNTIQQAPELSKMEARSRLRLPERAFLLLHVGSFREVKNHRGLLDILAAVHRRGRPAQLLLVGDGPLRPDIELEVRKRGLDCFVRFLGAIPDPWDAYAAADVFVFPSFSEGFANVLLEAQSAGLPVVASDIPAHRESVHSSQHRFLFPVERTEEAADQVLQQSTDAPWVQESRDYVREHFPITRFADDLHWVYDSLA